ncbi:TPA: hypothetical protein RQJ47_004500 [Vibrio vulnificus]|nr:hypothetical protein [Vibrio vulnificus]HDY8211356.1 hypothetical protein [Vibrio vulnificus]
MSSWKRKKFDIWSKVRRKGRGHYIVKMLFVSCGSVLLGQTIGYILFDKVRTWAEFWFDFGLSAIVLLVLGVFMGLVSWHISESWYAREARKQERT